MTNAMPYNPFTPPSLIAERCAIPRELSGFCGFVANCALRSQGLGSDPGSLGIRLIYYPLPGSWTCSHEAHHPKMDDIRVCELIPAGTTSAEYFATKVGDGLFREFAGLLITSLTRTGLGF